jgi:hypothetical protein
MAPLARLGLRFGGALSLWLSDELINVGFYVFHCIAEWNSLLIR